jgi:hypothetical protein
MTNYDDIDTTYIILCNETYDPHLIDGKQDWS